MSDINTTAPTPTDRVGEDAGHRELRAVMRRLSAAKNAGGIEDPETQVQVLGHAVNACIGWIREYLASAPAPSDPAGAGGDLGELERLSANLSHLRAAAVAVLSAWNRPHDLDAAGDALEAAVRATSVGQLVASTPGQKGAGSASPHSTESEV